MRNRGVEIFVLDRTEEAEFGDLDLRSILHDIGIRYKNHQEALLRIHKQIAKDSSNIDDVNLNQILCVAYRIFQQLSRGFPVVPAFKTSCIDVYVKARSICHSETKRRLISIIEETIEECEVFKVFEYSINLGATTCGTKNLLDNSKLAMVRSQGSLMDWCLKIFQQDPDANLEFVKEIFTEHSMELENFRLRDILPYALTNFYEKVNAHDLGIRLSWLANILEEVRNGEFLREKNEKLAKSLKNYKLENLFDVGNDLSLLLYYRVFVDNSNSRVKTKIEKNSKVISVAQFSKATQDSKYLQFLNYFIVFDFIGVNLRFLVQNYLKKNMEYSNI